MKSYYLIDYENVNAGGLAGGQNLTQDDHIYIFYTGKTQKVTLDVIGKLGHADINTIEVSVGKQSVDMHIASYLGYLIGKNEGKDCRYVIISKDKDYDNVIKHWKSEKKANVSKKAKLGSSSGKSGSKKQTKTPVLDKISAAVSGKKKPDSQKKAALNHEIQKAVSEAGFKEDVAAVAKIVSKAYGNANFLTSVHTGLQKKYSNASEIYKEIKPVLKKYAEE